MMGLHKFRSKLFSVAFAMLLLLYAVASDNKVYYLNNHSFNQLKDTVKPIIKNNDPFEQNKIKRSGVISDTIPANNRSVNDTTRTNIIDTVPTSVIVDTFSLPLSKDTLDAPVTYEAKDSAVLLIEEKIFLLYGKTKTTHKDVILTAPKVELNQETNILTAFNLKDSLGDIVERAKFEQGTEAFETDTITYNFKTQKGLTKNTYTQYQEMFIQGETIKKVNPNTIFISHGRFTTCNLDEPHFDFRSHRMKIVNGEVAVTGYVQLAFEDVPIPKPVGLPFGMFPITKKRHSGLLPPRFAVNERMGLGLEGLGYHKVINEYVDVTMRANIYSYGGWSASVSPMYRKRYRYSGGFNLNFQSFKYNFKGDPDFSKVNTFQINWSHIIDQKARPGTNFSVNVNAGSTRFNENIPNNPQRNFTNNLNSSITYSKTWEGKPYNLTLSANHSQNSVNRLINVSLPDASFMVNTIFPFQRKEVVGSQRWYEKIGVGYNGSFNNLISFYDTGNVSFNKILDTIQWGARHNVPLSIALPSLGKINISPGISYQEVWLNKRTFRYWDTTSKTVQSYTTKGFYTDRAVNFSISFNTALYGLARFNNSRITAIRHVIRPTVSLNYKPDLSKKYYQLTQINKEGTFLPLPQLEGGFVGGRFGGLSFGISNNVEMKVRSKDSAQTIKKIRIIDNFSINSGYNFLQDEFKLSPFSITFGSTLFDKVNISGQAEVDPYDVDSVGVRVNRFVWQGNRFSAGRLTNGSLSISTDFSSKPRDGTVKERVVQNPSGFTDPNLLDDQQRLVDYMSRNPGEFVDFNIPWSISLSLSVNFYKQLKPDYSGYTTEFNSSLNFNNSFSLTPKWMFSTSGYFDFKTLNLQTFQMSISREMHCWQMSIGVTPIGPVRFFNISISPTSSLLQDLKVNRTRVFYD